MREGERRGAVVGGGGQAEGGLREAAVDLIKENGKMGGKGRS